MLILVGNTEDRFSHNEAHFSVLWYSATSCGDKLFGNSPARKKSTGGKGPKGNTPPLSPHCGDNQDATALQFSSTAPYCPVGVCREAGEVVTHDWCITIILRVYRHGVIPKFLPVLSIVVNRRAESMSTKNFGFVPRHQDQCTYLLI